MDDSGLKKGLLTLDVEDWEHANFKELSWKATEVGQLRGRNPYDMDRAVDQWLDWLAVVGAKSTCFVLGEFARRYPEAVRRISSAGHEVASHFETHDLLYELDRERFRSGLLRSRDLLGELTGRAPIGFRAPSWSVDERTPWFEEELVRAGFRYDSSEFPVWTPLFGRFGAPVRPYRSGSLLRVPVTVVELGAFRFPLASGAFFRLAPPLYLRWGLRRAVRRGIPPMVVLHPRELVPKHPRLPLSGWAAKIHYTNLEGVEDKLKGLLNQFRWVTFSEYFAKELM